MKVIAHRGFWKSEKEQNTMTAFKRAAINYCGIETDIRSLNGNLVISHGLAKKSSPSLEYILEAIAPDLINRKLPICLNIKEDGLMESISRTTSQYPELDFTIFDASFPELNKYAKNSIPYLFRVSEYESLNKLVKDSSGIWLDSLDSNWITQDTLSQLELSKKRIFIVSPELHGRKFEKFWTILKKNTFEVETFLCTDHVTYALEFFKGS